jgi:hypothetical protein
MTEVTNAAAEAAEIASLLRPHFDTPAVGIDRIGQRETALGRGRRRVEGRVSKGALQAVVDVTEWS